MFFWRGNRQETKFRHATRPLELEWHDDWAESGYGVWLGLDSTPYGGLQQARFLISMGVEADVNKMGNALIMSHIASFRNSFEFVDWEWMRR